MKNLKGILYTLINKGFFVFVFVCNYTAMLPVYKNDPIKLKEYIDREVILETTDGSVRQGTIYTIDPVSECVVLQTKENANSLEIIFHHAVKLINCIGEGKSLNLFETEKISIEDLTKSRIKLKEWLQKNLIPIEECGDNLQFAGQITITPPYTKNDCLSSNVIVLKKIQDLIEAMPPT